MKRFLSFALSLVIALTPLTLSAQFGTTPSDGVQLTDTAIVDRDDALSIELNPAGLAFVQSWNASLVFSATDDTMVSGTGLFVAGRLFNLLGLGTSIQWANNNAFDGLYTKYSMGSAVHLANRLSIGLSYSFFGSTENPEVNDFSSWDTGIQLRATEWFGLGLSVRDFNSPRLGMDTMRPRVIVGSTIRFLNGRLGISSEAIHPTGNNEWFFRGRLNLEPFNGLRIYLEAQTRELEDWGISHLSTGLSFSLGSNTAESTFYTGLDGDPEFLGGSTMLSLNGIQGRSLYEPKHLYPVINLRGALPERGGRSALLGNQASFLDLLNHLVNLSKDDAVSGVVFNIENLTLGLSQHWELRSVLSRIQDAGKQVVVHLNSADFGDLYVASAADRLYMSPGINFSPYGIGTTLTYLGDLFGNLGILPEFVRIGEYKSAPEALSEATPSEATLEQINTYFDDVFNHIVEAIAEGRNIESQSVLNLLERTPVSPDEALNGGFIDGICFKDEVEERLRAESSHPVRMINYYNPTNRRDERWLPRPHIAVVYIEGDILEGQSADLPFFGQISGHRTLSSTLDAAIENGARAIVIRVNSPGGSAWASEAIWRSIDQADEQIPVVVSMGDVAASGGYYVAAGGREIFATDLTLTGSIGIFSGHFSADQLLQSTGIHRYPILRGPHSNLFGIEAPWSPEERDAVMRDITLMYDVFLRRVADNREISTNAADNVSRGRIWSGIRGESVGLIDQRGSIIDALERAAALAGLAENTEYDIISLPERSLFDSLVNVAGVGLITSALDLSILQNSFSALGLDLALRFPVMYGDGRPLARLPFQFTPLD